MMLVSQRKKERKKEILTCSIAAYTVLVTVISTAAQPSLVLAGDSVRVSLVTSVAGGASLENILAWMNKRAISIPRATCGQAKEKIIEHVIPLSHSLY